MEQKKIKVFSTPSCPYCVMVKQYLNDKRIKFEDIDVSEDANSAHAMFEKSHQMGVPQIWIGEEVVVGYDPVSINNILGIS